MSYRRKNSPKELRQSVIILSIMVSLGAVAYIYFMLPLYAKANELRMSQLHVPGHVFASYSRKGTAYAEFTYKVNAIDYSAKSEIEQQTHPGDPVEVYYTASDPTFASVDPIKTANRFQSGVVICGVTLLVVFFLSVFQRRQYQRVMRGLS